MYCNNTKIRYLFFTIFWHLQEGLEPTWAKPNKGFFPEFSLKKLT